jgi:hypothetical protein
MKTHKPRYEVRMIMGERFVWIVDMKKVMGLTRSMKLDVSPMVISEASFKDIFIDVVGAMRMSNNLKDNELVNCVTFPAGTTVHTHEVGGRA